MARFFYQYLAIYNNKNLVTLQYSHILDESLVGNEKIFKTHLKKINKK